MRKNIPIFFTAEFFRNLHFAYAIATLFYRSIGIDYTRLGILWVAMAVMQVLLEIPCGVLSDRIGHRATILLGYLASSSALFLIGSGTNFWLPFFGGAMWGVSGALLSGASDAFLYESLKADGRQASYLRFKGYHSALHSLGIIAGAVPGAYLFRYDVRWPWYAQASAILLALVVFSFSRNSSGAIQTGTGGRHLRDSLSYVLARRDLLWLTAFLALGTFPLYGLSMIRQPYLIERTYAVVHLGYIFASIEAAGVVMGVFAGQLEKALGAARSLLATVLMFVMLFLLVAVIPGKPALLPLVALYLCFRFQGIILNAYSNHRIPSDRRATILSVQAMGSSVLLVGFMLSSGIILDTFSIDGYLVALSAYVAAALLPLWLFRKRFGIE